MTWLYVFGNWLLDCIGQLFDDDFDPPPTGTT